MLSWFVPQEAKFFEMFRESADLIVSGAKELGSMVQDLNAAESRALNIKMIEQRADGVKAKAVEALHTTFITPLDRDDIYRLVNKMDDIMDHIDAASQRFHLFDIRTATPEIVELTTIILSCVERVRSSVIDLENMKNANAIIERCAEIKRFENEADHVMRSGLAKLFREEIGYKDLIKRKEVLELLESVTDRCEDVANIIQGIVLDHA